MCVLHIYIEFKALPLRKARSTYQGSPSTCAERLEVSVSNGGWPFLLLFLAEFWGFVSPYQEQCRS